MHIRQWAGKIFQRSLGEKTDFQTMLIFERSTHWDCSTRVWPTPVILSILGDRWVGWYGVQKKRPFRPELGGQEVWLQKNSVGNKVILFNNRNLLKRKNKYIHTYIPICTFIIKALIIRLWFGKFEEMGNKWFLKMGWLRILIYFKGTFNSIMIMTCGNENQYTIQHSLSWFSLKLCNVSVF